MAGTGEKDPSNSSELIHLTFFKVVSRWLCLKEQVGYSVTEQGDSINCPSQWNRILEEGKGDQVRGTVKKAFKFTLRDSIYFDYETYLCFPNAIKLILGSIYRKQASKSLNKQQVTPLLPK